VKTSGIYIRANPQDKVVLDGNDIAVRQALIRRQIEDWRSLADS
jgi:hypothetical protein